MMYLMTAEDTRQRLAELQREAQIGHLARSIRRNRQRPGVRHHPSGFRAFLQRRVSAFS